MNRRPPLPFFPSLAVVSLCLAGFSFSGIAAGEESAPLEFEGARSEVYKMTPQGPLHLHLFEPEGHDPETDRRPAIVFFFGGGWNGGSPGQFEAHARHLASRGMVAVSADYRVKSRQGTTPRECVADGKSAVRWLRAHADRLGIDPERLAAGGGSAGGHVAATTGICEGLDDPEDPDPGVSSKADALVLFNPVYDNGPEGYGHERVSEWFPAISPAHNLSPAAPPTVVFLGSEDRLIPVATAERFRDEMESHGVRSVLHLYEGQPHGFFNESRGGREIFLDTLEKMDAFLVEIGYLEPR